MRLGAHESIAGGLMRVFERADAHGCEAVQIFTTNGNRWAANRRDPGEISEFAAEARRRRAPLLAHDSYLINLAAPPGDLLDRSRRAFLEELERSEALGIDGVVMHPGAHCGQGVDQGLTRVATELAAAVRRTAGYRVRVLIELTAGQGTCLGASFEELRVLLDRIGVPERTGVCFDTCHAFAVGYDLRSPGGYRAVWERFEAVIGLRHLRAFHLNDSKKDLGSHVDRHAEIGAGFLGDDPFKRLVRDARFAQIPAVLELPPTVTPQNLAKLKGWRPARQGRARA